VLTTRHPLSAKVGTSQIPTATKCTVVDLAAVQKGDNEDEVKKTVKLFL
jgi:hypothetical protein